jgi:hypothetical protein
LAERFLSLRRHDPDQVRRVSAPRSAAGQRHLSPLPGHPLEEAIICRVRASRQGFKERRRNGQDVGTKFVQRVIRPVSVRFKIAVTEVA